ncbi:LamB/YcsF family protein [Oceanobacillus sojae]|uniref:LamB/YcsF family protein n=1 Tax=Oceanobacillus sojae TaxID=582851 RepID=UPI000988582E|nr:5-oxoprolinase subunit PxpA [Oceanobacillus sojae]MCT1902183.1 LamB/YcsF family protein [Oceanobacillus sojae]
MNLSVDLNCDLGESFGAYRIGQDNEVMEWITSANIACGYHAGDHNVMRETVEKAVENNVAIGAHPGLLDLQGFGRRKIQVTPEEVFNLMVYQIGAMRGFAEIYGTRISHVKPHGALYSMAAADRALASAIADAVYRIDKRMILFGLANSELVGEGRKRGLQVAEEVFADRTYQPDGTLTPRSAPNALIHDVDLSLSRVIRMVKERKVKAVDGTDVAIQADTICVHGDGAQAAVFVRKLAEALSGQHIQIRAAGESS